MDKVIVNSKSLINLPAHDGDAGYDLVAISDPIIVEQETGTIDYIEYDTGLVIEPEIGYHTFAMPRSSISKTNLVLANSVGLIDNGYRGTIKLRFKYILQFADIAKGMINFSKIYKKGDKIGQLVFAKTISPSIIESEVTSETNRGEGGFGSTGV
jgi:dUTP pyrophosphatase